MSQEERDEGNLKLKVFFVVLVTASSGLVALQSGADVTQVALALAGGFLVGVVLLWYLVRTMRQFSPGASDRVR